MDLRQTATAGTAALTFSFGRANLYPVVGDWNADGTDGIGTKAIGGSGWSLRNTASAGAAELTLTYGDASGVEELRRRRPTPRPWAGKEFAVFHGERSLITFGERSVPLQASTEVTPL